MRGVGYYGGGQATTLGLAAASLADARIWGEEDGEGHTSPGVGGEIGHYPFTSFVFTHASAPRT